jgi:hypothetical protein
MELIAQDIETRLIHDLKGHLCINSAIKGILRQGKVNKK